jgi:hypothetical protein
MRDTDDIENHMVLNTPDAPWNQPDAPEESAAERMEREKLEAAAIARSEFCDALVEIAEFLESHADVPLPLYPSFTALVPGASELARAAKALGKAYKSTLPHWVSVGRQFGPISLEISARREHVCRRIVTGTKVVPATTVPEHNEDIVEWECPPSLLASEAPDA